MGFLAVFPVVWALAIIRYSLTNKQPQKRGEFHLAFAMYKNRRKPNFNTNAFNGANQRKP